MSVIFNFLNLFYINISIYRVWRKALLKLCLRRIYLGYETARKGFNWALYESLRQMEREATFRLLVWAVEALPPSLGQLLEGGREEDL
jgi:hypothetical protein